MRVTLIEASDKENLVKYFKRRGFDFKDGCVFAHTISHYRKENKLEYQCVYLVFNRKNKWAKLNYGIIAHEATHGADAIFDYIDEGKVEECYAYLVEYLVKEICGFLNINNEIK